MAKPWEKYKEQPSQGDKKPWEKYQSNSGVDDTDKKSIKSANSGGYIDTFRKENEQTLDKSQAQLESFGNSLALGYAPNLQALVSASLDPNYFVDKKLESQGIKIDQPSFKERYIADRDQNVARQEQQRKDFPITTGAASLAGGIVGGVASTPLMPKALMGPALEAGTPLLQLVKSGALTGAKQGAAYGVLSNPGETKGEISPLQIGDRATNAVAGSAFGGLVGGGAPVLSETIKKAPMYLLSKAGGVDPEISKEFYNNMDRINNSKTPAELKDISDDIVGKLYEDVQSKKMDSQNAQLALKEFQDNLKQKYKDLGYEAKDALTQARMDLQESHARATQNYNEKLIGFGEQKLSAKENLSNANRSNIVNIAGILDTDIKNFQKQINNASKSATELISQDNVKLPTQPIIDKIDELIANENIINNKPGGDKNTQAVNYLKRLKSTLDNTVSNENKPIKSINDVFDVINKKPQEKILNGEKAKQLIQNISKDADYNIGSGSYNDDKNRVIKNIRNFVDTMLKSDEFGSPRYKAAMVPIAEDAAVLENAAKYFGDNLSSQADLANIGVVGKAEQAAALKALGEKTGKNYLGMLDKSSLPESGALSNIESSISQLKKSKPDSRGLPEFGNLQRAVQNQKQFATRNINKAIDSAVKSSPINQQIAETSNALTRAEEKMQPFKNLIPKNGGSQAERLINTLGNGKTPIDTERMFIELGKLSGTDFIQAMKDQRVLQTFEQASKRNPAVKTIMSLIGAAVGYHYGGFSGLTTGVGSTVAANAFGPKAVKSILEGAKKLSLSPTVKTLSTIDLPPEIKQNWANMLKQGIIRNGPPEGKK